MSSDWKFTLLETLIRAYPRWVRMHEIQGVESARKGKLTNEMRDAGIVEKVKRSGVMWLRLRAFNPEWLREAIPGLEVVVMNATDPPNIIGERLQALIMMNRNREFILKREGEELWIAALPIQSDLLGARN